ncbi:MAG TPA: hypothetical protein PKL64_05265 [Bacteroidales bacterium]|nr:hypothetical protein [Bacteroidales bacterium]
MNIFAEITGIQYQVLCAHTLKDISFEKFDINNMPAYCLISDKQYSYNISKWVSPKRSRSYPYERVYNTLGVPKRITVIPIIKDEGSKGDRDFIQWDTISLMSLLDVYVIFAYYQKADIHPKLKYKVTNQEFDNDYIKEKIIEISNYHSSALHWNLKEIDDTLPFLIDKVKNAYSEIGAKLDVKFHNNNGIEIFKKQFIDGVSEFKLMSRQKAKNAQNREQKTLQPKEILSTATKATITIKNYLGGLYYFTTDEIIIKDNHLFLIEDKHTKKENLPKIGDIKDGLLKMILYCNLKNVMVNDVVYIPEPVLKLTSVKIKNKISSQDSLEKINQFLMANQFTDKEELLIKNLFRECNINHFTILIEEV